MPFSDIFDRAAAIKGESQLLASLPDIRTPTALANTDDSAYLSEMAKCVFRSGFVWRVVEIKWPAFEAAFAGFNPRAVASFSDERLESLAEDASIIRYRAKIIATRENAMFVMDTANSHGSFGAFLANWPDDDVIGLLLHLKKYGSRLGGHTGQYFLRFVGKDTFLFSKDVVKTLVLAGIVDKEPTSQRDLRLVQNVMNHWRDETGMPYAHLSRIMAASIDDTIAT